MSNIGKLLKEEIQRLARKQVKVELTSVRRDTVRLKKAVAGLRREIAALGRRSGELAKKISPVVAMKETEEATEKAAKLRPTARSLKNLRKRLGLSQEQFGKLVGVSGQSVVLWENSDRGRLRLRKRTLASLAAIQKIGKREARRRLEQAG